MVLGPKYINHNKVKGFLPHHNILIYGYKARNESGYTRGSYDSQFTDEYKAI